VTAVAVVAGKASPGATTLAAAMTLAWPGPILLIDADPGGGDVVPGLLPGRASTESGLLSWSVATRHLPALDATAAMVEHVLALPEAGDAWVMPGLQSGSQAGALTGGGWTRLATAVERCASALGRDVVLDTGRLGESTCWPVIAVCDVVLLVVRPTARSVQAARAAAQTLRTRLGDLDSVWLVVNGTGPYTPAQTAAAVGIGHLHSTRGRRSGRRGAGRRVGGHHTGSDPDQAGPRGRPGGAADHRNHHPVERGSVMSERVDSHGRSDLPATIAPLWGTAGPTTLPPAPSPTPSFGADAGFGEAVTELQQRVATRLSADGTRYVGLDGVGKRLRTQALVNEELESWVTHRAQVGLSVLSAEEEDELVAAVQAALGGLGPLEPLLARTGGGSVDLF